MADEKILQAIFESELAKLRNLSFDEVCALPNSTELPTPTTNGCGLIATLFVQPISSGNILATVQIAEPGSLGMSSRHFERGLVYSSNGQIREASDDELLRSGG